MGDLKLRNTGNPVLLQKDALFFLILFFLFGFLFLFLNWWSQCRLACSYIRHHLWQIISLRGPWNWCPYVGYCYWLLKLLSYTFLWKPSKYDTFRTRRHKFVPSHCPQKIPMPCLWFAMKNSPYKGKLQYPEMLYSVPPIIIGLCMYSHGTFVIYCDDGILL